MIRLEHVRGRPVPRDPLAERAPELLATLPQTVGRLLSDPVFAVLLGLAAGAGLLVISRLSFRAMRPANPEAGLAVIVLLMFVRMALAAGILLAVRAVAGSGFVPFAISLAGGFLCAYMYELVKYAFVPSGAPGLWGRTVKEGTHSWNN